MGNTITQACEAVAAWHADTIAAFIVNTLAVGGEGHTKRDAIASIRAGSNYTEAAIERQWKRIARPATTRWSGPWVKYSGTNRAWFPTDHGMRLAKKIDNANAKRRATGEPVATATIEVTTPAEPDRRHIKRNTTVSERERLRRALHQAQAVATMIIRGGTWSKEQAREFRDTWRRVLGYQPITKD